MLLRIPSIAQNIEKYLNEHNGELDRIRYCILYIVSYDEHLINFRGWLDPGDFHLLEYKQRTTKGVVHH